jgi:hypothetical protein
MAERESDNSISTCSSADESGDSDNGQLESLTDSGADDDVAVVDRGERQLGVRPYQFEPGAEVDDNAGPANQAVPPAPIPVGNRQHDTSWYLYM